MQTRNDGAWRIIDTTTNPTTIDAKEHHLTITTAAGTTTVPAADISTLLAGEHTTLTGAAHHCLATHHIVTLHCDWRSVPYAATHPWPTHTRVTARHRAQATLPKPRAKAAWQRIITAKIRAQATTLRINHRYDADQLTRLATTVRSGDPTNTEATAARTYWAALTEDPTFTRGRYAPHPFNRALNYGYAILRAHTTRAILTAGLHPPLAFHHHSRGNYYALTDDLIEPFRPVIDHTTTQLLPDLAGTKGNLTPHQRRHLATALTTTITPDRRTLATTITQFAQHVAACIETPGQPLHIPAWEGPQ